MLRKRLFAWMMHRTTGSYERLMADRKQQLFQHLPDKGRVVEIGAGTGPNLRFLPAGVEYVAIEPNRYMHPFLTQAAAERGIPLTVLQASAERLALPDNSVDAAISTLVLCSVARRSAVLAEILRVLRPGAPFFFLEHVAAEPGRSWHRGQRLLYPLWRVCADGCQLTADTRDLIRQAGFATVDMEEFVAPLGPIGPHIYGQARK